MVLLQWDESLDVAVEPMNEQHRVLIDLMNTVYAKNSANAAKAEVETAIEDLMEYVVKHFRDEEAYMESMGFPGLDVHKKLHHNLLSELNRLLDGYKTEPANRIGNDFMVFLKFWLSTHIRGIDTLYGAHARQAGK